MSDVKKIFFARVQTDLAGIETALQDNLDPYLDLVHETASHLLFSGGKRFRPLLMVLGARLCRYRGDQDKLFSTAFEYIHAATLLHDDLIDGARLRRGKPAAYRVWDAPTAVLVGDFLLAKALSIGAKTGRLSVIRTLSEVTEQMAQGELHQLMRKGAVDLTEDEYMTVIRRKTAELIAAACKVGALIADAPVQQTAALSAYGMHIGMAFQMADDLLDYTADTGTLGKAVGTDLNEGKLTLPVIRALAEATGPDRAEMEKIIAAHARCQQPDFDRLVALMKKYGGLDYTRRKAAGHVEKAKTELALFPPSETKEMLLFVADYALDRTA